MADRREYEVDGKSLSQLRVVDLKQELEKRGLPKSGSKKELVDRLKVQLQLEKLQECASTDEGHVPNLKLQDDAIAEQNDVIKEYLAKQQQIYEVQKEVRRRVELEELKAQESSEAEASPGETSQEDDETAAQAADKGEAASGSSRRNTRHTRIPARARVVFDDEDDPSDKEKKRKDKEEEKEPEKDKEKETRVRKMDDTESGLEMEISVEGVGGETLHEKKEERESVAEEATVEDDRTDKDEPGERSEEHTDKAGKNAAKVDPDKKDEVPEGSPLPCDLSVTRTSVDVSGEKQSDTLLEEDRKGKSGEVLGGLKAPDVFSQESDTSCEPLELTSEAARSRHSEAKADDDFGVTERGDDQQMATVREEKMDAAKDQTSQEPINLVSKGEEAPALDGKDQQVDDVGDKGTSVDSGDVMEETRPSNEEARDLTCATGQSLTQSPSPNHERSRSRSPSRSRTPSRSGSRSSRSSSKSKSRSRSGSRSKSGSPSSASRSPSPSGRRLPVTKREPTPLDHEAMDAENSPSQPANDNGDSKANEPMEVAPSPGGLDLQDEVQTKEDSSVSESEPRISSRRISLSSNKENGEKPARKRRWGSTSIAKTSLSISTDSLKGLIPDVKTSKDSPKAEVSGPELAVELEEDLNLEPPVAKKDLKIVRTVTQVVLPPKIPEKVEAPQETKEPVVTRRIVLGRQVSRQVTTEDVETGKRAPSPARNQPTKIVHIRNLVRPFTLNQLKEMLGNTGVLVNDGFWIDKIKSKCYVTYSSVEEAVATRLALHGTKWPSSNPKNLMVDFAEQDELDFHKNLTVIAEGARPIAPVPPPPMQPLLPPTQKPAAPSLKERNKSKEKEQEKARGGGVGGHQTREPPHPRKDQRSPKHKENVRDSRMKDGRDRNRDRRGAAAAPPPPIREWDRDKIGERSPGERDRARMQAARERRRSPPGAGDAGRRAADRDKRRGRDRGHKEEEAPAKLLDDLFRKTKATPCIYWLPLTVDQIKQKEEERRLRQMEREKRKLQIAKEERDKEEALRKEREKERDDVHRNRAHMPRKH